MELKLNLEAIRNRYASYVSHIYESIKDTVSVESLRVYLLDLSALDCDKDEDEERYKLLSAVKARLNRFMILLFRFKKIVLLFCIMMFFT